MSECTREFWEGYVRAKASSPKPGPGPSPISGFGPDSASIYLQSTRHENEGPIPSGLDPKSEKAESLTGPRVNSPPTKYQRHLT